MFTENQKKEIKETMKNPVFSYLYNSLDINYLIDSEHNNLEEFTEFLNDYIREHEIIYYSEAINFLRESDPSLRESLEIAEQLGYSPKNLNSEILATLLIQSYMDEEASKLIEEIETILEEEEEEEN
jgi:hypothetical protein